MNRMLTALTLSGLFVAAPAFARTHHSAQRGSVVAQKTTAPAAGSAQAGAQKSDAPSGVSQKSDKPAGETEAKEAAPADTKAPKKHSKRVKKEKAAEGTATPESKPAEGAPTK